MTALVWIITISGIFHVAQSYVLISANIEDLQSMIKQLSSSRIGEQIGRIWRRASDQFNQNLSQPKYQSRVKTPKIDDTSNEENSREQSENVQSTGTGNNQSKELETLKKNANFYLSSIKKIFENV